MTVARSGLPWSASSGHKSGCFLKLGMLRFIPPMLFVAPSRSRPPEGNDRIWAAKVFAAPVVPSVVTTPRRASGWRGKRDRRNVTERSSRMRRSADSSHPRNTTHGEHAADIAVGFAQTFRLSRAPSTPEGF